MRTTLLMGAMAIAALVAVESAAAQGHEGGPPILGYRVVLKADDGARANGELIAVTQDSLWLLRDDALTVFALARMKQVDIQESSFGPGKALLYSLAVGAISGALLTAACSSVEGADCDGVLPGMVIGWTIIGGIGALAVGPSRYSELVAPGADQLRPYSRFPQGMPDGFTSEVPAIRTTGGGSEGGGPRHR